MINTAVIGWGLSATVFHIPFIVASGDFHFSALCTSQTQRAASDWPDVRLYTSPQELLADDDIDLVIIATPNDTHFDLARRALELGRHVIVDKPFVTSSAQGEILRDLARSTGRVLAVFHNRRWDGDFLTVRNLIESGRVGEVRALSSHFDRFRPVPRQRWREQAGVGTGIWYDLGPHLIDQALCLFGMPEAVTGRLRGLRQQAQTTDYCHVQLHYPDKEVLLHCSPFCAAPNLRFQLEGTLGTYVKYGLDPQEDRLRGGVQPSHDHWAAELPGTYGVLYREDEREPVATLTGGYQHYFAGVARAIREGVPPPVTAEDGLAVIRLIERVQQSHEKGRTLLVNACA